MCVFEAILDSAKIAAIVRLFKIHLEGKLQIDVVDGQKVANNK